MTVLLGAAPTPPAPDPDAPLADALTRFLTTKSSPDYLRTAAEPWIARKALTMNPALQIPARARAYVYGVFGALSLTVGATQVGYAALGGPTPDWLAVALAVVPFVGAGIGYTAATHTPAADNPDHRLDG